MSIDNSTNEHVIGRFRHFAVVTEDHYVGDIFGFLDEGYPFEVPEEFIEVTEQVENTENMEELLYFNDPESDTVLFLKDNHHFEVKELYVFEEGM